MSPLLSCDSSIMAMFDIFLSLADGYGFNVKGGRDKPFREGDSCIYITRLRPGAVAEKDGRLSPGDRIVEVCDKWPLLNAGSNWLKTVNFP